MQLRAYPGAPRLDRDHGGAEVEACELLSGQVTAPSATVAGVAAVPPGRIMPVIAQVIGHLALEGGLQQPLRELLEQPTLTRQLQPIGLSPSKNELADELVIHHRRRGFRRQRPGYVLAGHRCTLP